MLYLTIGIFLLGLYTFLGIGEVGIMILSMIEPFLLP